MRPSLPALCFVLTATLAGACGGSTPELAFSSNDALAASYELYGGRRAGDVELQRTIKVVVDTAVNPADAESHFEVQVALARFTPASGPVVVTIVTPPGAALKDVNARVAGQATRHLSAQPSPTPPRPTVDPDQVTWAIAFEPPPAGAVLEAIIRFVVPGTLASDAQWLAGSDAEELLLRYDLPGNATGAFQVVGASAAPVVTEQNGRKVIALFVKELSHIPAGAHARYTTTQASPKGYEQRFAATWGDATADYTRRLIDASNGLDEGHAAPFRATEPDGWKAIYAWVRGRPGSATSTPWHAARGLPGPLAQNTMTGTDRVHLLHWLLAESGVSHRFAMARLATRPKVNGAFAVPAAFEVPLIYLPGTDLFLDPGCAACAPGEVREPLRGGQAILLPVPATGVELRDL